MLKLPEIKSGSILIDIHTPLPSAGLVEYVGYPRCGMTSLLRELCRANSSKNILYVSPHEPHIDLGKHVLVSNISIIESLVNTIYKTTVTNNLDIIIIDTLPDLVSRKELEIMEEKGIEHISKSTRADIWFESFRILREVLIENKVLLVIGNIRRTKLPRKSKSAFYHSDVARQSAQSLDKFTELAIMLEVVKKQTTPTGTQLLIDHWCDYKINKGLPIPIHGGIINHEVEKFYILSHQGILRRVGNLAYDKNGNSKLYREMLSELDSNYNLDNVNKWLI